MGDPWGWNCGKGFGRGSPRPLRIPAAFAGSKGRPPLTPYGNGTQRVDLFQTPAAVAQSSSVEDAMAGVPEARVAAGLREEEGAPEAAAPAPEA